MAGNNDPESPLSPQRSNEDTEPGHSPHLVPGANKLDAPLYLAGQEHLHTSSHTNPTVPVSASPAKRARKANFKQLWLLVTVSWIIITAIALGLLFFVLPSVLSSRNASPIHTQTPAPTTAVSSSPVVSYATPPAGLAIIPNHFNVVSDCQVDNGYRCTATLIAPQSLQSGVTWSTYSNGVATKFNPPGGTLSAGQQLQVIIYIYNQCPYDGTLVFSIAGGTMTVPAQC